MAKRKGGKPRIILTDEQKAQVEALASVLTTEQLSDYLGIARRTFYDIMERDEELSARYKKGRAKAIGVIAKGIIKQAMDGNFQAACFYLKTQAGWRETDRNDNHNATDIAEAIASIAQKLPN